MTYSVQDARERLDEILERVRSGESVVISEDGQEIVEIRAIQRPASTEDKLRRLEEEGILSPAPEYMPSLEEVRRELEEDWKANPPKPGGLARFLESR
jgi:antitoxin (DNA-binding transcriptional repressor) of toxin-antitoxin stability system